MSEEPSQQTIERDLPHQTLKIEFLRLGDLFETILQGAAKRRCGGVSLRLISHRRPAS